jgi:predicted amidohydrolase YtcJ
VVGDRPVWLERVDGHAGWANSAALKAAGITAATKAPDGGAIDRRPDGTPAGVLVDAAMGLLTPRLPAPRAADRDAALAKAQSLLFQRGVTAVADMGTSIEDWQAYRRAGDKNQLYVRIMAYAMGIDQMALIAGGEPTPWLYADRLRMGGVKLFMDGALGSRGAWLKAPYADAPATRGLPRMNDTQLGNLMSRAAMDNFRWPSTPSATLPMPPCSPRSTISRPPTRATAAGAWSMPRSSIRPISRALAATG